ncbi:hypothetical protein WJX77_002733 [Trebouxia sp. C0004]
MTSQNPLGQAEGSWILRCQCKHRHKDHDPPHSCLQQVQLQLCHVPQSMGLQLQSRMEPDKQVMVKKEVPTVQGLLAGASLSDHAVLSELLNAEAGLDVTDWTSSTCRGNAA